MSRLLSATRAKQGLGHICQGSPYPPFPVETIALPEVCSPKKQKHVLRTLPIAGTSIISETRMNALWPTASGH
ncbi:hypothetical protein ATY81_27825 [Rhizobium sp. R72]|nr:hypothetical protein ATY81_27825 [Rhizobium sp. R72]OWV96604.1 hypothetical protein ATY80_27825 [Rhizobium sp. R711]